MRQVLTWGLEPDAAPYTHQEIAHWCDRLFIDHQETDDPPDIAGVVRIAGDVDCQWDLYLVNTYSLDELRQLDYAAVKLPRDWFTSWLDELDAV